MGGGTINASTFKNEIVIIADYWATQHTDVTAANENFAAAIRTLCEQLVAAVENSAE